MFLFCQHLFSISHIHTFAPRMTIMSGVRPILCQAIRTVRSWERVNMHYGSTGTYTVRRLQIMTRSQPQLANYQTSIAKQSNLASSGLNSILTMFIFDKFLCRWLLIGKSLPIFLFFFHPIIINTKYWFHPTPRPSTQIPMLDIDHVDQDHPSDFAHNDSLSSSEFNLSSPKFSVPPDAPPVK